MTLNLLIRFGGLGLRKVCDVPVLAFISPVHFTVSLIGALTSRVNGLVPLSDLKEATERWSELSCGTGAYALMSNLSRRNDMNPRYQ